MGGGILLYVIDYLLVPGFTVSQSVFFAGEPPGGGCQVSGFRVQVLGFRTPGHWEQGEGVEFESSD